MAQVTIDGRTVTLENESNVLEVARKSGIDIPTFCYHSELSVYGACRLCLVDIEGRGIVPSCSTPPADGMVIRTNTEEIRKIRRMVLELLLANHDQSCPTCPKSSACKLRELARRLGVEEVRFPSTHIPVEVDTSTAALVRDPNKCILCGDCVRMCSEVQGIGAIDLAYRGDRVSIQPAFGKKLSDVECVYCGQCARVCPTGALRPKSEIDQVWAAIHDSEKRVVAQIAPAVRVAIGESFGLPAGSINTGQIVAACKAMGFDRVYDTCFAADLTVVEESEEFLRRAESGGVLPQFTSCCPAWVKFCEQYFPDLIPNLSSCRSPQQMFGSIAKSRLTGDLSCDRENLVVVSIMPCTAKKFEKTRPEFVQNGLPDVDYVLTTQELAQMVEEYGIRFSALKPESLDLPLGFKTGAGVLFGNSGGVTEAVLRYVAGKTGSVDTAAAVSTIRSDDGFREAEVSIGDKKLKIAIVHGLAAARRVAEDVRSGNCGYDFIEVMACPGGCIGGAGQPVTFDRETRRMRAEGIYEADKMLQLHASGENPYIRRLYDDYLGTPGSETAHALLHTHYRSRKRIDGEVISLITSGAGRRIDVSVCMGTSCLVRGSQRLLQEMVSYVEERGLEDVVNIELTFCLERCHNGPNIVVDKNIIEGCTFEKARIAIEDALGSTVGVADMAER